MYISTPLSLFPHGPVLHSSSYRSPAALRGRALVVGCAFSGADVAAELGAEPTAPRVTVAAGQTPLWFVPRHRGEEGFFASETGDIIDTALGL